MKKLILMALGLLFISCNSNAQQTEKKKEYPITKTEEEWKAQLTDLQYYVLREAGTERE